MAVRRTATRRKVAAAYLGRRLEYHNVCFFGDLGYFSWLEMGVLHTVWLWIWPIRTDHGVSRMSNRVGILLTCFSWGNEICSDDNEERAIVVGSMNEVRMVLEKVPDLQANVLRWHMFFKPGCLSLSGSKSMLLNIARAS